MTGRPVAVGRPDSNRSPSVVPTGGVVAVVWSSVAGAILVIAGLLLIALGR